MFGYIMDISHSQSQVCYLVAFNATVNISLPTNDCLYPVSTTNSSKSWEKIMSSLGAMFLVYFSIHGPIPIDSNHIFQI